MQKKTLTFLLVMITVTLYAQDRLKPGQLYPAGSPLWGPRIGVKATVPENWNGLLPRDEEIFLLSSTNSFAEIFVMGSENDSFDSIKERWKKGVELGNNIFVKADGEPMLRGGDILAANLTANNSTGTKGYIEAKCGPFNVCLISMMTSDPQNYERNKKGVQEFMDGVQFEKPSTENPYTNFDWDPFLRNKQLVTFAFDDRSSKETIINLCADGTFKANLKKSGLFKENGLKGKKTGTWTVNGIGPTTKLVLTVDKMGTIETTLEIRDEKVFANGERYFVSAAVECK